MIHDFDSFSEERKEKASEYNCYKEVRDLSDDSITCFYSFIQTETWPEVFSENDTENKWNSFYSICNYYFNTRIAFPKVR
jgi:hypothetical protein